MKRPGAVFSITFVHRNSNMTKYNNARALRALTKASLQAIFKSPSAIVFSLAFPLIFILVFGLLGTGKSFSFKVAPAIGCDSNSELFVYLHTLPVLKWVTYSDTASLNKAMKEDVIVASIDIKQNAKGVTPRYKISITGPSTESGKAEQVKQIVNQVATQMDPEIQKRMDALVSTDVHITQVRDAKMIDFILPGQLGFSLLAAGVFGTAFIFFNLRQTLVLKRFFATPVKRSTIVLGEGIARLIFQIMGSVVIIGIGHYAFGFTLVNGWITFIEMLFLCGLGLMVFMGFGFIISSLAKNDSSIPPLANIITMPQFLLAGTFFPIDNFPKWLQPFCRILPLTYLNDAMRRIAFDGVNLWDIRIDLLILIAWGVLVYFVAGRIFKWE